MLVIFMIMGSFALSMPTLQNGEQKPLNWNCQEDAVARKQFMATTEVINVGLVCPVDARIVLYWCGDSSCEATIGQGFKVSNKLIQFTGFTLRGKYSYDCFKCKDIALNKRPIVHLKQDSITIREGEKVIIDAFCDDREGDETDLKISGWMDSLEKVAEYTDSGVHGVVIECHDEWGARAVKNVVVTVADINRPPEIVSVEQKT